MTDHRLQPVIAGPAISPGDVAGFRFVGSSAPSTTGWIVNDLWLDTTNENTTGQVIRRWNGTVFKP